MPHKEKKKTKIIPDLFRGSLLIMTLAFVTATIGMIVDGLVIGRFLGEKAMSASGLVSPVFLILCAIGGAFSAGAQNACARRMTVGEMKKANQIFSLTLVWLLIVSAVFMIFGFAFRTQIAVALGANGAEAELLGMTRDYLTGILIGVPAIMLALALAPFMELDNDRPAAIVAVGLMTVVNVTMDLLNVKVFHGGMFGMAIATTSSYYLGMIPLIIHVFRKTSSYRFTLSDFSWNGTGELVAVGLPSAIARVCLTTRTFVFNNITRAVGTSTLLSAYTIQNTVAALLSALGLGIGSATLMIVSVVYGEEDEIGAESLFTTAAKTALLLNAILAAVTFAAAGQLAGIFVKADEAAVLLPVAVRAVRYYAFIMFFDALNIVVINYLQGMGELKLANLLCAVDNLIYAAVLGLILGNVMGETGVWLAFILGEILTSITVVIAARIRNGRMPSKIKDFLFLPKGFGVPAKDRLEMSITSMEEVVHLSEGAYRFCLEKGGDRKKALYISLAIEEMAGNIIEHGFGDGKPHSIDLRLVRKGDEFILRMRDDCRAFDPESWLKANGQTERPEENIGIRMVFRLIKDIKYVNTVQTNNLIVRIA